MLPAVTRTVTAAVAALALAAATVQPAQALGKNERNFLKGVFAAVVVHELVKQGRANAQPAPAPVQPKPVNPGTGYSQNAAAAAFYEFSPQARRMIQQRLAAYGYYRSGIDGSFGPGTYSAVAAYARDTRMAENLQSTAGAYAVYDGLLF